MRCLLLLLGTAVGCASTDAATDAAAGEVAIMDAPADTHCAIDAAPDARCATLTQWYCDDHGFGTPCHVPCSYPPECRFDVVVRFSGGCCVENQTGFFDCVCESGYAVCAPWFGTCPRELPASWCAVSCEDADAIAASVSASR